MISYTCISNECFRAPLWASEQFSEAQAYLDLLTCAEFGRKRPDSSGKRFDLKRGQGLTAKRYLHRRWGVGRGTVEDWFKRWEGEGRASVVRHGKHGIVITLHDYDKWVIDQRLEAGDSEGETCGILETNPEAGGAKQSEADETPVPADKVYKESIKGESNDP